jgi:Ig-like domain CHU_C associated
VFRLTDLDPRTYTANHVVITSTATLEKIKDTALAEIPANPIKVDFDNQGTYDDYTYSGYYTVTWSPAQASGISVTLDFQDPQVSHPEVPIVDCAVADLPAIPAQPIAPVIDAGQTATLSVTAGGTGTLHYQWYQGVSGDTTTPVGTDSTEFTAPALSDNTPYWVRVSSDFGYVDSNTTTVWIALSHVYAPLLVK